jgi:hypothetical protein
MTGGSDMITTDTNNVIELFSCPCCGAKPIDEPIRALLHVMNAHGFPTTESCCGHRGRPREGEAYVVFSAGDDGIKRFAAALRSISTDMRFGLEIMWKREPENDAPLDYTFTINDDRGRAPKAADLADLAAALDRALRGGCESAAERRAA